MFVGEADFENDCTVCQPALDQQLAEGRRPLCASCHRRATFTRMILLPPGPRPDLARIQRTASPEQVCVICDVVIYGQFRTCRKCNRQIHARCMDDYVNVQEGFRQPAPCPACRYERGYDSGSIYDPYVIDWERNRQRYTGRHPGPVQQQDEAESPTTHESREQQRSLSRQWEESLRQPANLIQQDQVSGVRQRTQTRQTPLPPQRGFEQQGASPLREVVETHSEGSFDNMQGRRPHQRDHLRQPAQSRRQQIPVTPRVSYPRPAYTRLTRPST